MCISFSGLCFVLDSGHLSWVLFGSSKRNAKVILRLHCIVIITCFMFIRGTFFFLAGLTDLDVPWQNILFVVSNTTLFLRLKQIFIALGPKFDHLVCS